MAEPANKLWNDVFSAVISETRHPELYEETKSGIQEATLKLHKLDEFAKDETNKMLTFVTAKVHQMSVPLSGIPFLRKLNGIGIEGMAKPLTRLKTSDIFLMAQRNNCWMQVGTKITVKAAIPFNEFWVSYLANPDVRPESYDSWIAREHKFAIRDEVCKKIFMLVGDNQKSSYYASQVQNVHSLEILKENIENLDGFSNTLVSYGVD